MTRWCSGCRFHRPKLCVLVDKICKLLIAAREECCIGCRSPTPLINALPVSWMHSTGSPTRARCANSPKVAADAAVTRRSLGSWLWVAPRRTLPAGGPRNDSSEPRWYFGMQLQVGRCRMSTVCPYSTTRWCVVFSRDVQSLWMVRASIVQYVDRSNFGGFILSMLVPAFPPPSCPLLLSAILRWFCACCSTILVTVLICLSCSSLIFFRSASGRRLFYQKCPKVLFTVSSLMVLCQFPFSFLFRYLHLFLVRHSFTEIIHNQLQI